MFTASNTVLRIYKPEKHARVYHTAAVVEGPTRKMPPTICRRAGLRGRSSLPDRLRLLLFTKVTKNMYSMSVQEWQLLRTNRHSRCCDNTPLKDETHLAPCRKLYVNLTVHKASYGFYSTLYRGVLLLHAHVSPRNSLLLQATTSNNNVGHTPARSA